MSFIERKINVQFRLNEGSIDDSGNQILDLANHRCEVIIENKGTDINLAMLQMRIFGMKKSDMDIFSIVNLGALITRNNQITVFAGDDEDGINQVFNGTIMVASIDYASAPNVGFVVTAQAGYIEQIIPAKANSFQSIGYVADIIASMAKAIGYQFINHGVDTILNNQYLSGSIIEQIKTVAYVSRTVVSIENGTIEIWPYNASRGEDIVFISPENGLVGYPAFVQNGILIKTLFNKNALIGRKISLTSSVEKANGEWYPVKSTHRLSTLKDNGEWFTELNASRLLLYKPVI
jgi:hypothetical protein